MYTEHSSIKHYFLLHLVRLRNCADLSCTKRIFFSPEMAMMKISASFPHGMDVPAHSHKPISGRYCTGFHSNNASHAGSLHWCGGVYVTERPPIYASFAPSLLLCGPPYTAVICSNVWRHCSQPVYAVGPTTYNGLTSDLKHLQHSAVCRCPMILYPTLRLSGGMNKSISPDGINRYRVSP